FCGYHLGDYLRHWLDAANGYEPAKLPGFFFVNWFRKGRDGKFLWPGFGENARVLKWVFERVAGNGAAVETPIGLVPAPGALDAEGLAGMDEQGMERLLAVDPDDWRQEAASIRKYFEALGDRLPRELWEELDALEARLDEARDARA
ncbi:MAG TPA: phosphoenolpyruvate carboxykinase domain-containing protein, partial [Candidatus Limnocylindria bacterium]|nr:phosphoenolpyruvate carboxykinase domain-containing protein [Candidatus Limnocylindria bacterium]